METMKRIVKKETTGDNNPSPTIISAKIGTINNNIETLDNLFMYL
tara:strand:+ start:483 stop:617 length:135 start_codon:yes stop_codon:yes gene_type:complete